MKNDKSKNELDEQMILKIKKNEELKIYFTSLIKEFINNASVKNEEIEDNLIDSKEIELLKLDLLKTNEDNKKFKSDLQCKT